MVEYLIEFASKDNLNLIVLIGMLRGIAFMLPPIYVPKKAKRSPKKKVKARRKTTKRKAKKQKAKKETPAQKQWAKVPQYSQADLWTIENYRRKRDAHRNESNTGGAIPL